VKISRRLAFIAALAFATPALAQEDLDEPVVTKPKPPNYQKRDAGEQALFYVASIAWAGGIPIFINGLASQDNAYAQVNLAVDFLVPLVAPIGIVIPPLVDLAYGKRRGVPQTITTSMLLGFGEGIALNEYFSNRASTSFHTLTKDAWWLFGGTTVGMISGLVIAGFVPTTPGRAAWVGTTGLFTGLLAASIAGAASRPSDPSVSFDREGRRNVGITGAIAGAAGIAFGLSTATLLSPSDLRVHLIDLGWIGGAVISGLACNKCGAPDAFAAIAIGSAVGFGATFAATNWLKHDGHPPSLHPVQLAPYAYPTANGGIEVGIAASM
jgi:hypothetical protein